MSETTDAKKFVQELEATLLKALDRYFELLRGEVEEHKGRTEPGFKEYEAARQSLEEVDRELGVIHRRMETVKAEAIEAVAGSSETSELEEGVSELQVELSELVESEQSALRCKKEAEERLERVRQNIGGDLGEAAEGIAAFALLKAEEIDAFKGRLDQRFAEGRTSVLRLAT